MMNEEKDFHDKTIESDETQNKKTGGLSDLINELGRAAGTAAQGFVDIAKQFTSSANEGYHSNRSENGITSDNKENAPGRWAQYQNDINNTQVTNGMSTDQTSQNIAHDTVHPHPKFCFECGARLSETSKFCPECGKKII